MQLRNLKLLFAACLVFVLAGICFAQNQIKRNDRPATGENAKTKEGETKLDPTRFTWEFKQEQFIVSHIRIEHDALGRGKLSFQRKGGDEPVVEQIELSQSALTRIMAHWTGLRFLDSNENYQASKNFAHLGRYILGMDDGRRQRRAEFNWSNNASAWQLAHEYRRVADQAMFVFDITIARENQPLNAPGLMNQLESLYKRNGLSDPKQLVPLLKEIRTDEHLPLMARNQADRLLKKIEK